MSRTVDNVFELVYKYKTADGVIGVVRADSIYEAIQRIEDAFGHTMNITAIVALKEFDNDFGVVTLNN